MWAVASILRGSIAGGGDFFDFRVLFFLSGEGK
jgi:hypothetical protein